MAQNVVQMLRDSAVLPDSGGHDVIRVTGGDRIGFLNRITTGKIAGLAPGQGSKTLLLDVRGHVLASLLAFVRADDVRLIAARGQGSDVAAGLSKYAIMDDVQITMEPDTSTLAVLGPSAASALRDAGVEVPAALDHVPLFSHTGIAGGAFGEVWVAHGRALGSDGLCVALSNIGRQQLVAALVAKRIPTVPPEVAEPLRIAALEPAAGKEITPERFPVEVGLGAALDHTKGCYVGQETIVRMRDRGNVRKRLALLRMASDGVPSPGDGIASEGEASGGVLTSVARNPGEPAVALAVLSTKIALGTTVCVMHAGSALAATVVAETPPWG